MTQTSKCNSREKGRREKLGKEVSEEGGGEDTLRTKMSDGVEKGEGVSTMGIQQEDGQRAMMRALQVRVRRKCREGG